MGRPSEEKSKLELKRLEILHEEQEKIRRKIKKASQVKKGGYHLPGEERHKREIAVFLKLAIPNISFTDIGARIGEPKSVVKEWFKQDPAVKELYEDCITNLKQGTLNYLETLGFEAAETMAILMRYGSEKFMYEAAKDILDRIGIAKVSKQEISAENKTSHEWSDRDALVSEIRELPEERQEEALDALEKFERLLAKEAGKAEALDGELAGEEFESDETDG